MFNIEGKKSIEIKNLARKLYIETEYIERVAQGAKMSELLSGNYSGLELNDSFSEEMLYLADFPEPILNIFLTQLRRRKCTVELKAVKTPTNLGYTAIELYKEISAEHREMQGGKAPIHQT